MARIRSLRRRPEQGAEWVAGETRAAVVVTMTKLARILVLCALASAVGAGLGAGPAAAQGQDMEVAVRLAYEGKQLLDQGRCGEALPKLDASLTILPHAKTKFFKAFCLNELDLELELARDLLTSIKGDPALEQYTAELPDVLLAIEGKLRPLPLVVTVEGGGAGDVKIDGVIVGSAPYRGTVERGRHDVQVVGPGCDDAPRLVETVGADPILVTVRCEPPRPATVEVRAPDGVLVSLDDVPQGRAPLARPLEMEAGAHTLTLERRGEPPQSRALTVESGQHLTVEVMSEARGGSSAWAWTTLATGTALVGVGTGFLVRHGIDLANKKGEEPGVYTGDTVRPRNAIIGGVALGMGVGLVVTSFFLWPDDDGDSASYRPGEPAPGLSLQAGPDGATVGYTTRF